MVGKTTLMAATFGFITLIFSSQVYGQADAIEKRQKLMKGQSAAAKAIKGAVEEKDYATVEAKAKDLMNSANQIPDLFPKGSDKGKTKAKAEIWEKSAEFNKDAKALNKAASELAAAAKSKDDAAIAVKVKAIGETCSTCHKEFRAQKYGE